MTTRSRQLHSIVLATILAIGAGLVWGLLVAFAIEMGLGLFRFDTVRERVEILSNGTPVIESTHSDGSSIGYRTLDGKPTNVSRSDRHTGFILQGPDRLQHLHKNLSWPTRMNRVYGYAPTADSSIWYLLHDGRLEGHAYLVGYDWQTNLCIGYVGHNGFREKKPALREQFPIDGSRMPILGAFATNYYGAAPVSTGAFASSTVIITDEGLTKVNFQDRTVHVLLKEPKIIWAQIGWLGAFDTSQRPAASSQAIMVRLPDQIVVCDPTGKKVKSYPLSPELRDATFEWFSLEAGKTLITSGDHNEQLYWLDPSGKIIRQEHADLHNTLGRRISDALMTNMAAPTPGGLAIVLATKIWMYLDHFTWAEYFTGLRETAPLLWSFVRFSLVASVVVAVLCFLRHRKYGLPWTWTWTLLVLVFGVPAYLGYLLHRVWPVRLPCPHCGQLAPRDRPACLACGRDFPAPAPKGTEVFA